MRRYTINLTARHKLIVGEGESDRAFLSAFCAYHGIDAYDFAFTGMHSESYNPSGFDCFQRILPILVDLADFDKLTDLVLVCDSGDNPESRVRRLRKQIEDANSALGRKVFADVPAANAVSDSGVPRVHLLRIPMDSAGGLESICVNAARDKLNNGENVGSTIEGWVNTFAASACDGWTTEKRDKLRLQAFLSAAWKSKPDLHFSQIFDITGDRLVPLDAPAFAPIRGFLEIIATL